MIIIQQVCNFDDIVIFVVKYQIVKLMFVDVRAIATCNIKSSHLFENDKSKLEYETKIEKKRKKIAINKMLENFIYVNNRIKNLIHQNEQ